MYKPKVLGFMSIHYAGSYLRESLLSVVNHVDQIVIAYSHKPSQGHKTNLVCPDSRDYIYNECLDVLGSKMIWDEKESYPTEASHRDVKYKYVKDHDLILTVDADEIMLNLQEGFNYALTHEERHYGFNGYMNFFRSHGQFCLDGFRPIRLEKPGANNTKQNLECPVTVLHFSLCQSKELLTYKFSSFGHANEIRPNYLEEVFYKWTPDGDIEWLHPVSLQIWQHAVPYAKRLMPEYLKVHPNHNLEIIP